MYDLAIIGGGPAGVGAGVYASRKLLKTVFITEEWGGQSVVSAEIQNWIGTVAVTGIDFAEMLKKHLKAYKGDCVEIVEGDRVAKVERTSEGFKLTTKSGKEYTAKTLLVTAGAHRRKLEVPGADEFDQKGLTYCASCDGPLFAGQDVAVIGGGNAGFETAAQLLAYAKSVTLLHRRDEFKADPVTVERVLSHPKMQVLKSTEPTEVKGEQFVKGLVYKNNKTGETGELPVTGVFVEIGLVPNTDFVADLLELDEYKRIKVNPKNQQAFLYTKTSLAASDARRGESGDGGVGEATTKEVQRLHNEAGDGASGVWAAGDCTNELYHQNNIACGDAVKALEDIYVHLRAR